MASTVLKDIAAGRYVGRGALKVCHDCSKLTAADATKYREELLQQIPGAKMGTHWDLNYQVLLDFKAALAAKSEEAIQWSSRQIHISSLYAYSQSGHHGV